MIIDYESSEWARGAFAALSKADRAVHLAAYARGAEGANNPVARDKDTHAQVIAKGAEILTDVTPGEPI